MNNNRNTRVKCDICLELTIKIPERCQWCRSGIFIVNFEHVSCSKFEHVSSVSIANFEYVIGRWVQVKPHV